MKISTLFINDVLSEINRIANEKSMYCFLLYLNCLICPINYSNSPFQNMIPAIIDYFTKITQTLNIQKDI